ncbi:MAG: hypothetical protein M0R80_26185 [Proteobacteria bacterium]|nr:hypothetical protein [Pseudomonadota bacterium]
MSKIPGCPGCERGEEPEIIDEDGVLSSLSGKPGKPGHGMGDYHWHCDHYLPGYKENGCDLCGPAPEICECGHPDWAHGEHDEGRECDGDEYEECDCKGFHND